jgi:hypothetical protein
VLGMMLVRHQAMSTTLSVVGYSRRVDTVITPV